MRPISLLLVAAALGTLPACLLLRQPDNAATQDADVDVVSDTDQTTDGSPGDDTDTDPGSFDTDLVASDTDPGETDVTDTDSGADVDDTSLIASDTDLPVTANQAPTISTPTIGPSPAYNDSTLTCGAVGSDPDGTTPAVSFAWTNVSSGADLGAGAAKVLTAGAALPGEVVRCSATASDGMLMVTSSATVVLENRVPTVDSVTIAADAANPSMLTCSATASDADGTDPAVSYLWTNLTQGTTLGLLAVVTVNEAVAAIGDTLRCTATATDGQLVDTDSVAVEATPSAVWSWKAIPAGTFTMGCVVGRDDVGVTCPTRTNELPAHSVTLTRGFWMMQSEVTQAMWSGAMGNAPSSFSACGSACPVEQVSWWDATAFANEVSLAEGLSSCYTLSGCSGSPGTTFACTGVTVNTVSGSPYDCEGYRLPTEAEWEYAARGAAAFAYSGSDTVEDVAWYDLNAGGAPHATCTKALNGYGLCDMSGNVYEWIWDVAIYAYLSGAQNDPTGPTSGSRRGVRGGCWNDQASEKRVARRDDDATERRSDSYGLRLVRTVQ